jgi:hypothetical protein
MARPPKPIVPVLCCDGTVLSVGLKDLRGLLAVAWPFAGIACWYVAKASGSHHTRRWTAGGVIVSGLALAVLYCWLAPTSIVALETGPQPVKAVSRLPKNTLTTPSVQEAVIRTIYPPLFSVAKDRRDFVSLSPDELAHPYKQHTEQQAALEASCYLGKWLAVSGKIANVTANDNIILDHWWPSIGVNLTFSSKWKQRLLSLQKGDSIYAADRIDKIDQYDVNLDDCEIMPNPPAAPATSAALPTARVNR